MQFCNRSFAFMFQKEKGTQIIYYLPKKYEFVSLFLWQGVIYAGKNSTTEPCPQTAWEFQTSWFLLQNI